ncbi:MAG: hypothetical protein ACK595_15205, partial [Planctomycetota bacterium]
MPLQEGWNDHGGQTSGLGAMTGAMPQKPWADGVSGSPTPARQEKNPISKDLSMGNLECVFNMSR